MPILEDTKKIIASNLALTAALIQLVHTAENKKTTSEGDSEAFKLYEGLLVRLGK